MGIEEIAKNLQNLSQQVEELVKLQNDAYSKLQPEVYEKVKQHQVDINEMMREVKSGNFLGINKFTEKYADINRK
jgi:predicted transcriptional regulator